MYTTIIVLTVLVSILLIIVVLIQKSKGGGLASNFAGSNQVMGVRRTNDFIEKATWTLAGIIWVLAVVSVFVMPRNLVQSGSRVRPVQQTEKIVGTEFPTPVEEAVPAQEAANAEAPVADNGAE